MTGVRSWIEGRVPIGTRTLLWGVHCWFIHPFTVALGWTRLFGFPRDPRMWVAFLVHDWGYWGKRDLDGDEGNRHPELGASIMGFLFGKEWGRFTLLHSRYLAKRLGVEPSDLCAADKVATRFYSPGLYLWLSWLSGEREDYLKDHLNTASQYRLDPTDPIVLWARGVVQARMEGNRRKERRMWRYWFTALCDYMSNWADKWLEEKRRREREPLAVRLPSAARAGRGVNLIVVDPDGSRREGQVALVREEEDECRGCGGYGAVISFAGAYETCSECDGTGRED